MLSDADQAGKPSAAPDQGPPWSLPTPPASILTTLATTSQAPHASARAPATATAAARSSKRASALPLIPRQVSSRARGRCRCRCRCRCRHCRAPLPLPLPVPPLPCTFGPTETRARFACPAYRHHQLGHRLRRQGVPRRVRRCGQAARMGRCRHTGGWVGGCILREGVEACVEYRLALMRSQHALPHRDAPLPRLRAHPPGAWLPLTADAAPCRPAHIPAGAAAARKGVGLRSQRHQVAVPFLCLPLRSCTGAALSVRLPGRRIIAAAFTDAAAASQSMSLPQSGPILYCSSPTGTGAQCVNAFPSPDTFYDPGRHCFDYP